MDSIGERYNQYQGSLIIYFAYVITRFRVQLQRIIWKTYKCLFIQICTRKNICDYLFEKEIHGVFRYSLVI